VNSLTFRPTVAFILTRTRSRSIISPLSFRRVPARKKLSPAFREEFIRIQETPIDAMRKREELKAKRNLLFQRFLKNPLDTRLALKIKTIDEQVAKCTELMERKHGPNHKT
jgi:hypothetical protein